MKRIITVLVAATVLLFVLTGCSAEEAEIEAVTVPVIQPGGTVVMQQIFY